MSTRASSFFDEDDEEIQFIIKKSNSLENAIRRLRTVGSLCLTVEFSPNCQEALDKILHTRRLIFGDAEQILPPSSLHPIGKYIAKTTMHIPVELFSIARFAFDFHSKQIFLVQSGAVNTIVQNFLRFTLYGKWGIVDDWDYNGLVPGESLHNSKIFLSFDDKSIPQQLWEKFGIFLEE